MDCLTLLAPGSRPDVSSDRRAWGSLPWAARQCIIIVSAAGLACAAAGLAHLTIDQLPTLVALLLLAGLASTVKLDLPFPGGGSPLSLSYVVNILSIMVMGPWQSVPVAVAGAWTQCAFRSKKPTRWYETLFSVGTLATTVAVSGVLYQAGVQRLPGTYWATELAVLTAASAYFLLNTGLASLFIAVSSGDGLLRAWTREFLWSAPTYYLGAGLTALAVEVGTGDRYWWLLAMTVPAYLIYRSCGTYAGRVAEEQRQVRQMADVQLAVVEALALAIEAKDNTSRQQLERMQVYSEGLARALLMTEPEVRGVKTAALLHDIGNLAVPEHILSKPGALSYDEFDRLKIHPRVGADIIKSVPFPYPVVPLVLSHHERWDGRGYPSGLKGQAIPVGARILAVVDCFTSMLSERPYRPSHTYAEAIATLRENAGAALDPALVEKFIEVLPSIESRRQSERAAKPVGPVSAGTPNDEAPAASALDDIAVAHREDQAVRDISEALNASLRVPDVLAVLSTSLVNMMPVDACALFMLDPASTLFLCSHAVGDHQDAIRRTTAGSIEGLASTLPAPLPSALTGTPRLQSGIVAPLDTEAGTIGAIAIYHASRDAYSADHRRLLSRVATHAANIIANALLFEETQEQSLTDVLTGLPNRRSLDRHLAHELARVRRHGGHLSLLVLDMDGFKQINDAYGHQAGDLALREVAQVLRESLRTYDVCARFAGDEFISVISDCDAFQAERRRADLQREICSLTVEPLPGQTISLGASIGAATFPEDAESADGLISVADRRMYRDKQERRLRNPAGEALAPGTLWP